MKSDTKQTLNINDMLLSRFFTSSAVIWQVNSCFSIVLYIYKVNINNATTKVQKIFDICKLS